MKELHFPGAEHAASKYRNTPELVSRALLSLFYSTPPFNYRPLHSAIRDVLVLGVPYDQVYEGIKSKTKLPIARKSYLEVLPLIRNHFDSISPDFVNTISERRYGIAPGISIPIRPPFLYGLNGQLVMPWPIFWKTGQLSDDRLSLLVSIVQDMMEQDPFFDDVKFELHFFDAPKGTKTRRHSIVPSSDVPVLPNDRRIAMFTTLADGFKMAKDEIEKRSEKTSQKRKDQRPHSDPDQASFDF